MSKKKITKELLMFEHMAIKFQSEVDNILNPLSDKDNVISEEYLDNLNYGCIETWISQGDITKDFGKFLMILFRDLSTRSRVIKWSAERLKSGEWKTYNKYEGL